MTAATSALEVDTPSQSDGCNHSNAEVLGEHRGNRRHRRL